MLTNEYIAELAESGATQLVRELARELVQVKREDDELVAAAREAIRLLNISLSMFPVDRIGTAMAGSDLINALGRRKP